MFMLCYLYNSKHINKKSSGSTTQIYVPGILYKKFLNHRICFRELYLFYTNLVSRLWKNGAITNNIKIVSFLILKYKSVFFPAFQILGVEAACTETNMEAIRKILHSLKDSTVPENTVTVKKWCFLNLNTSTSLVYQR